MNERAFRADAVDVLGRLQIIENARIGEGLRRGHAAGSPHRVDRLARAKLARRGERRAIDRPVGMVVGDPGRLDLVFQLFALDCLRAAGADGVRRIRFLAFELRLSHRNRWTSAFGIGK